MTEEHRVYEYNHEGLQTLYVEARFDLDSKEEDGAGQWHEFWEATEFNASYEDFGNHDELASLDMIFSRPHGSENLSSIKEQIKDYIMKEFNRG